MKFKGESFNNNQDTNAEALLAAKMDSKIDKIQAEIQELETYVNAGLSAEKLELAIANARSLEKGLINDLHYYEDHNPYAEQTVEFHQALHLLQQKQFDQTRLLEEKQEVDKITPERLQTAQELIEELRQTLRTYQTLSGAIKLTKEQVRRN